MPRPPRRLTLPSITFVHVVPLAVAALLGLVLPGVGKAQSFSVGVRLDFATGAFPYSVVTGDVNGDGTPDLVVANYGDRTVSVLLGNGAGGYGAKTDFATGTEPLSVAIGDVNGDGKPDLAVANYLSSTVSVLLGNGAGGFGARTDFATGSVPVSVVIEDVSGDGRPDLAVANYGSNTVSVLLGNGAGGFGAKTDIVTGAAPQSVAIGDVNGDGKPDLAVACSSPSTVSVQLGNGVGGFGARTDFATGSVPVSVVIEDVSGDGRPDLAVANYGSSTVSVLLAKGAGGFGARTNFAAGNSPFSVAIGDVSGDGKLDLAPANSSSNTVSVLLGNGAGGFGAKTDFGTGGGPSSVAIGDVSGDGKPDLVTANYGTSTVSVLLGNGTGGFGAKTDFVTGSNPSSVAIGDVNVDGKPDLVAANGSVSGAVSVLLGNGAGGFGAKTDFVTGLGPYSVAIRDLNGDGKLDLAVANGNNANVSVLLGNGAGGFGAKTDFVTGTNPISVAIEDVNGDGRPDLAVANASPLSSTVSVLLGLTPTHAALAISPSLPVPGASFTYSASVSVSPPGNGTPTGTVSFFDGQTLLGVTTLNAGLATFSTFDPLLVGHTMSAVYSGDGRFLGAIGPVAMATSMAPHISSIRDVPADQGGRVELRWDASALDRTPGDPITQYWIWRQVPGAFATQQLASGMRELADPARGVPAAGDLRVVRSNAQIVYWEYVGSQISHGYPGYSLLAATALDSVAGSNPKTIFMVEAEETSDGLYWSSAADSGYSVDNLSPPPPAPFTAAYAAGATHLHWGVSSAADFATFRLYRGASADFTPGPGDLVAATPDTGYVDAPAAGSYYKLSAVDLHGNESGFAALGPAQTAGVGGDGPVALALEGAQQNPTRRAPLSVTFGLPRSSPARLELLDVSGRRAAWRDVGALGAGRHTVDLAEDRRVAPGFYIIRLTQGGEARTRRVLVVE